MRTLREELSALSPVRLTVRIGEVEIEFDEESTSLERIHEAVADAGFEVMTLLKEQKIEEVKEYVREHLSDPEALRLSLLSRTMLVSPFHLSRTFSLLEGETLQEFIARTRMERAAQLLRETERPILDVCFEVGLNSTSHFSKQFKKHFGLTPLAYRKDPSKSKKQRFFSKIENDVGKHLSYLVDRIHGHVAPGHGKHPH
ncbi:MAG: helix-turn-helix domain-containing protein [Actinobacteria bacterium]|nr:helix-turn-helix domain-containing protein [Actinomycetota bacterium]